jgi:hypothetical protein
MAFNLVEAEGLQEFWDEFPEPKREETQNYDMDYTNYEMSCYLENYYAPDDYICWRGARIGDSIQAVAY